MRDVAITGIGLVSSLGEGRDAHWQAMRAGEPNVDALTLAPYPFHPLAEPDWTTQISRRDKRQMEPWQQIGTYAAGLALDDAGLKETEATATMDMIVAAGGGERDIEVDGAILEEAPATDDRSAYEGTPRETFVAERLANDLRPTLFLAQLSNLLAGNISIVHKVTGSSRTYMGEEGAGIAAVANAVARVGAGQSECMLVGGSFAAAREDMMLVFELGQYLAREWQPVWARDDGLILGSVGAFLVLEPREAAEARGATVHAVIECASGDHGGESGRARRFAATLSDADAILSGASGVRRPTRMERDVLAERSAPLRAYGSLTGHGVEAHFPLGVALAAICLQNGGLPAPVGDDEAAADVVPESILVTGVGHWRGEGAALVRKA